uniref:HLA class II histocompatibility antigen, DQ beta 2 chain-like n=1 Tax=Labrus bergylta TaxID=56723 RepID=A0A3Q3FK52_9LABR
PQVGVLRVCLLNVNHWEWYALYANALLNCVFTSTNDVVYLGQLFINKVLWGEYNSTVGKYVGFTEKGRQIAEEVNKNPSFLKQEKKNLEKSCYYFLFMSFDATDSKHPRMLVCSVYNFYPKQINVRWLRNGKEVTSDVTSTEELPNGNWLYQMHSYLEMTPRAGEKIACMVEHASFQKPKLYEWGKRVTESVRNQWVTSLRLFLYYVLYSLQVIEIFKLSFGILFIQYVNLM